MKVAVNKEGNIVDLVPDNTKDNSSFIVSNNYILLDIANPVSKWIYGDNGSVSCEFRELVPDDYIEWNVAHWKEVRQKLVDNIEIAYNGVIYQGDETSQDRISRAVVGMPSDDSVIQWKAKDNSVHILSRVELKTVLYLAGQKQTEIWFIN